MSPERIQLKRTKGWRMPPNTVKVDRTTKWGNPFLVEGMGGCELWDPERRVWLKGLLSVRRVNGPFFYRVYLPSREVAAALAVERFAADVAPALDLSPLCGKNLACWCKPGSPCHADVLLELANAPNSPSEASAGSPATDDPIPSSSSPTDVPSGKGEP